MCVCCCWGVSLYHTYAHTILLSLLSIYFKKSRNNVSLLKNSKNGIVDMSIVRIKKSNSSTNCTFIYIYMCVFLLLLVWINIISSCVFHKRKKNSLKKIKKTLRARHSTYSCIYIFSLSRTDLKRFNRRETSV